MAKNAYEIVADSIISQLENNVAPWRKDWVASGYSPLSLSSKKAYKGMNSWLLSFRAMSENYTSPWWGTYKQITEQGGSVRKGEKGTPVVLWKQFDAPTETNADKKAVVMRYFTVFSAEQAEWEKGAPHYETLKTRTEVETLESAEKLLTDYFARDNAPKLAYGGDRAYYSPSGDNIQLPERLAFETSGGFYSTAFHEMGHSTGHRTRLNRDGVVENHYFGSETYSEEELVAEFTAAFLSSETGILPATLDNSTAYIKSWLKVLKNEPKMLVKAVGRAQKAANYIINKETTEVVGE